LAKSSEDRLLVELIVSGTQLGRPLATTPGVPEDRLKALREAFAATMKDREFLEEAKKLNFEVEPVLGDALQKVVAKVLSTPKSVADRARPILQE
jgi:hypothetical protein